MEEKKTAEQEKIDFTLSKDEIITDFYDVDDGVAGNDEPDFEQEIVIRKK